MPRNDSAVAGGSLWGAEARETSGCCSNASRDACAVFRFTPASNQIKQLSLYFDRYLMSQHLTLPVTL
jgi:hypothetical protein